MTVYVIVQLKMTDRAAYDRYQARFFECSGNSGSGVIVSRMKALVRSRKARGIATKTAAEVVLLANGFAPVRGLPPRPVAKPEEGEEGRRRIVIGPIIVMGIIGPKIPGICVAMMMRDVTARTEIGRLLPFAALAPRSATATPPRN